MRRSERAMRVVGGVLKEYAWGRLDGLVPWHPATGGPQAELWFGAHPGGPAPLIDQPDLTLADVDDVAGLPLVKLLSAAVPLSIQVHPDAQRAAAGFAAQQRDPHLPILYADDAEKSEVLIALSDFDAHAGWRDRDRATEVLIGAGLPESSRDIVASADRVAAMRALLDLEGETQQRMVERIVASAVSARWHPDEISSLDRVASAFPGDPGVLVTVLLAHHRLRAGEALVVRAGIVHSYVEGLGVEVMTSSDNVLRLGLTHKAIAIDEALSAIQPDRGPIVLRAADVIDPAGLPFTITFADARQSRVAATGAARVILCLEGVTRVDDHVVPVGGAGVLTAGDPDARIVSSGRAVVVTARSV